MADNLPFERLISRVRAGDGDAAAEIVRCHETAIRSVIRVRLSHSALRRYFDSIDICQSVLAAFFQHAALGAFALDSPEELRSLLVKMARNKFIDCVRHYLTERRDDRRVLAAESEAERYPDPDLDPLHQAELQDLLAAIRGRLSTGERFLFDQRRTEQTWPDIATMLGESPDCLRMRLDRAVERALADLGLPREQIAFLDG